MMVVLVTALSCGGSEKGADAQDSGVAVEVTAVEVTADEVTADEVTADEVKTDDANTEEVAAVDTVETAVCQPDCEGKECGLDGCGGSCGACPCEACEEDEIVCQWGGVCSTSGGDEGCCEAYVEVMDCIFACSPSDEGCLGDCIGQTPMYCEPIWQGCLDDVLSACSDVCPSAGDWEEYPDCHPCMEQQYDVCVEEACALVWYGPLSCSQMWLCVLDCANGDSECADKCLGEGNKEAKEQWALIEACLEDACGESPAPECQDDALAGQCADLLSGCVEEQPDNPGGGTPSCEEAAKDPSSLGCEFWAVDLDNAYVPGGPDGFYDAAGQQYAVAIANPHVGFPALVTISDSEEEVAEAVVPGGSFKVFNLPRRDADGTILAPLAYRLVATIPVMAFQFNPLDDAQVFSNDATVLYPTTSLGKEYRVVTREQTFDELRSYLTVVAAREGETVVTVDVPADTLAGVNVHTGGVIGALSAGSSVQMTLKQFDVLNIETANIGGDMTGAHVLATKEVVVFGGSEASNAPNTGHCLVQAGVCEWDMQTLCTGNQDCVQFNTCCADHLEHQMPPVHALGQQYRIVKTYPRAQEEDVYRVVAVQNGTTVTCIPQECPETHLDAGQWFDFESKAAFTLVGDKPVLVAQFIASQDAPGPNVNGVPQAGDAGIGDPAMLVLTPTAQCMSLHTFLTPGKYQFDYVTIVVPPTQEAGVFAPADVWLDCDEADLELCAPLDLWQYQPSPDNSFFTARLQVEDGFHKVRSEAPVAVYAYGYDNYVSYGYSAGSNLKNLGLAPVP